MMFSWRDYWVCHSSQLQESTFSLFSFDCEYMVPIPLVLISIDLKHNGVCQLWHAVYFTTFPRQLTHWKM